MVDGGWSGWLVRDAGAAVAELALEAPNQAVGRAWSRDTKPSTDYAIGHTTHYLHLHQ